MIRVILLLAMALAVPGCATGPIYDPPSENKEGLATIRGHSHRTGVFQWENYRIDLIDNQTVSYILRSETSYEIPVHPGEHSFVIFSQFNRSFWSGSCPCQAFVQIEATLEPGKAYRLNGKVEGVDVRVWIEEEQSGERISEIAKGGYRPSPRDVFIPVFL